ncbi:MAG TPA: ABC transporter permease [Thermoanaerobaculia bacterium]
MAVWLCTAVWMAVAPAFLSLLGALEWKSLPFPQADRILQVNAGYDLIPLLHSSGSFQALANYETGWVLAEGPRGRGSVPGAVIGEELFEVLGTRPVAGRVFARGSAASDAGGAVITESLSRRLFGGARPPAGAVLRALEREFSVLGVVADEPVYPPLAQIWVLDLSGAQPDRAFLPRDIPRTGILGRLAEGTSARAAHETALRVARDFEKRENRMQGDVEALTLETLLRRRSEGERGILRMSLAALLGFVLLAYTSALAGFAAARQGETAVRLALGARRLDVARLLFLHVALLAIPGFLLGLPVAVLVLGKLSGFVPLSLAELIPTRLDAGSLALAAVGWLAVALASLGLVWASSPQAGLVSVLTPECAKVARTRPRARVRFAFVCAALSLAVALGAGAAVLRESLANLERVPLGFAPEGMASAVVRFGEPPDAKALPALLARIADRLGGVPGIAAVSFSDGIPLGTAGSYREIASEDYAELWLSRIQRIHGDYARAAGLRLVAGRTFARAEEATGAAVALLDENGAREIFGGRPPLGETVVVYDQPVEIVGVVPSVKGAMLDEPRRPQLYLPLLFQQGEKGPEAVAVLLRLAGGGNVPERELEVALAGTGAALSQARPLPEIVEESLAARRMARNLAVLQWLAALALVALAMFGTFSWLLEVRALEHAIRLALGDTRAGIARRILRSALGLVAVSAVVGVVIYLPAGQALRALLFGVEALSAVPLLSAAAVVALVGFGAAALAARSALRGVSLEALRNRGNLE